MDEQELPVYPVKKRYIKDEQVEKRIKQLKKMREKYSRELDIEPGFLLNNALIEDIAIKNPNTLEDLENLNTIRDWQIEVLGEVIT